MGEVVPEDENPPDHDQIIDIDKATSYIDHTGRSSRSFVKSLANFPGTNNIFFKIKRENLSI